MISDWHVIEKNLAYDVYPWHVPDTSLCTLQALTAVQSIKQPSDYVDFPSLHLHPTKQANVLHSPMIMFQKPQQVQRQTVNKKGRSISFQIKDHEKMPNLAGK
jgi:hypothetical protein